MTSAETIARALDGRTVGEGWMARCPSHDDREPSLSIRDADAKVLVCCHAGCDQRDVITALKDRGLWEASTPRPRRRPHRRPLPTDNYEQNHGARTAAALAIWKSTIPANGTPVETYLAARGLPLPLPPSLRFHCGVKHPSGGVWPCMIALVTRGSDGTPVAIHRTFLSHDGSGKAPVEPTKMMLGPCRGGAVRLAELGDLLMIGEGIDRVLLYPTTNGEIGGNFSLEAEIFLFPGEAADEYGLFLGGQDIDTSAMPDYSAFVLRRDGQAAVLRRRAGQSTALAAWQRHEAIVAGKAGDEPVKNILKVDVDATNVTLWVNAAKVAAVPRADVRTDGRVGFRIGKDMNLHITTLNVTRKLAPVPAKKG
jgi:hypothetical protein